MTPSAAALARLLAKTRTKGGTQLETLLPGGRFGGELSGRLWAHSARLLRRLAPKQRALLMDLDNLNGVNKKNTRAYLKAVLSSAGPQDVVVAAVRADTVSRYTAVCEELGIKLCKAPLGKNGADFLLLAVAHALHAQGVEAFTILSGDRAFKALPGEVTLMETGNPVPEVLRMRAKRVISNNEVRALMGS